MRRAFFLALCIPLVACTSRPSSQSIKLRSPEGKELILSVEIADEPHEQQRGLMFRDSLAEGTGMLFVFPKEEVLSFWMKNTRLALDIVFFDANGRFVSTLMMEPCSEGSPCPSYRSQAPAQYALEVPAGYVQTHGIRDGWKLEF